MQITETKVKEEPKYVIKFTDITPYPKNESIARKVVFVLVVIFAILVLLGTLLIGKDFIKELPFPMWIFAIVAIGYLVSTGGYDRIDTPSELWFYDDN